MQPSGPQQAVTPLIPEETAVRAVPAEAAAQEADQAEGMYPQMEAPEQLPWRTDMTVIDDGEIPLAPLPKTGNIMDRMSLTFLLSGIVLTLSVFDRRRHIK